MPLALQGEEEGRTFARSRLGPDAAAVAGDNADDDAQTDARAAELGLVVQPAERGKQPLGELHIEAAALISDEKHRSLFVHEATHLDA